MYEFRLLFVPIDRRQPFLGVRVIPVPEWFGGIVNLLPVFMFKEASELEAFVRRLRGMPSTDSLPTWESIVINKAFHDPSTSNLHVSVVPEEVDNLGLLKYIAPGLSS